MNDDDPGLYRFHFYDWSTSTLIDTLPVESSAFGQTISTPGTFTGTIPLIDKTLPAARVLAATQPLRTKVFVERGTSLVWGGRLTEPRSYDSATGKLTVNGEETIGYFKSRYVPTLWLYGQDQVTIAETVMSALQSVPAGNAGLTVVSQTGLSGVLRDGVYSQYDYTDGLTAITDITEMQFGFEFTSLVRWSSAMVPQETLLLAYPYLGRRRSASPLVLEYDKFSGGGNVKSYTWPDGPGLFTRTWADATTPDGVQLDASADNTDLMNAGYPLIEQRVDVSGSKPTTKAQLQAYANRQAGWADGERVAATFIVPASDSIQLGDWQTGDDILVRITDYRFPPGPNGAPGFAGYMRLGTWSVSTDTSGMEQYTLTTLDYTEPL